ncbi:MAG: hypothetical protein R8M45_01885 [Ghiorsea sp.]
MMTNDPSRLCWDHSGLASRNAQGEITFTPHTESSADHDDETISLLPPLADDITAIACIYLPLESLLARPFYFPLQHRRHLDTDMLDQDLADTAGINPDHWWLSWRADKSNNGISGMVFGLRQSIKHAIQEQPTWQQTPLLLIDGWERLQQWLTHIDKSEALAVVDTDAEGVFFGFIQDGAWQGMRRLNADMNEEESSQNIAEQMVWSLQDMGMVLAETYLVGRLTPALAHAFPLAHPSSPPLIESALPHRHILNLMLPNPATTEKNKKHHQLNVRHGQWAAKHSTQSNSIWQRSSLLAACLCFLWLGLTTFNNMQLENKLEQMNDALTQAFHRGLPHQPVIIDALAQLRQAANSGSGANSSNAQHVTEQLGFISGVFAQYPWQMQELKIDKDGILLAGKVDSLHTLNTMRTALEKMSGSAVQIADTDLSGGEVSFRMRWQ